MVDTTSGSAERVAFDIATRIAEHEKGSVDLKGRAAFLDLYAECIYTVRRLSNYQRPT